MKKRLISLLVLTIVLAAMAPAALANHCLRCKPLGESCVTALNYGFQICEWDTWENTCYTEFPCGSHAASVDEPLAAEFTVASVERLDEPQNGAAETLVASAATPAPATR